MKKIYKTHLLVLLNFNLCFYSLTFSQSAPPIQWQKTIGGSNYDNLYSLQQTTDGGFILGGESWSNISGDKTENCIGSSGYHDYWIVKADSNGNVQWDNTIGGSGEDELYCIRQTADGGYIMGGDSWSGISGDKSEPWLGGDDYWIVKTDSTGNIQWDKTIGSTYNDELRSLQQTADGGYILGGSSALPGFPDYWIVKANSSGNIMWQNYIGGSSFDNLWSIQQTTDGGYILGGYSQSNISGDKAENCIGGKDYWIVKTNASGSIQWQNTIGGSYHDYLYSIRQTADKGYILGGVSFSDSSGDKTENAIGTSDYWIVKADSVGNVQWENTIGGDYDEWLFSVQQTTDGGYIVGGYSKSNISGDKTEDAMDDDYWIVKTDSLGNIIWQNTIGGSGTDKLYSIQQTSDGGYILGGSSSSDISGDKTENSKGMADYWIVKLGPDTITSISQLPHHQISVSISPNPVTDKLNIIVNNKERSEIILYDMTSRKLLQKKFTNSVSLNTEQLAKGLYLYEVRSKDGSCKKGKVVKD